jgi:hypothetical protein
MNADPEIASEPKLPKIAEIEKSKALWLICVNQCYPCYQW